jgi:hypothetical protein
MQGFDEIAKIHAGRIAMSFDLGFGGCVGEQVQDVFFQLIRAGRINRQAQVNDRMFGKVVVGFADPEAFEPFPIAGEKGFQRAQKQCFAETAGSGQKEVSSRVLPKGVNVFGFVRVQIIAVDYFFELLIAQREFLRSHRRYPRQVDFLVGKKMKASIISFDYATFEMIWQQHVWKVAQVFSTGSPGDGSGE